MSLVCLLCSSKAVKLEHACQPVKKQRWRSSRQVGFCSFTQSNLIGRSSMLTCAEASKQDDKHREMQCESVVWHEKYLPTCECSLCNLRRKGGDLHWTAARMCPTKRRRAHKTVLCTSWCCEQMMPTVVLFSTPSNTVCRILSFEAHQNGRKAFSSASLPG